MHPRNATLLAFCDGEARADRNRRIAKHLSKCEKCSSQVRNIQCEKEEFAAGIATPGAGGQEGLAKVLSTIAAWQGSQTSMAASELKGRLRWQIETYFGAPGVLVVDRPGMRAEELLGKASEIFEVFLGPEAAEAVNDDILRKLNWAGQAGETYR